MDNSDKIFEKIKNASLNQKVPEFQSMEKVWSHVESKLDNKVLKKQNKLWKKLAIAASFLLVFTVSYQIFIPKEDTIVKENQRIDSTPEIIAPSTIPSEAVAKKPISPPTPNINGIVPTPPKQLQTETVVEEVSKGVAADDSWQQPVVPAQEAIVSNEKIEVSAPIKSVPNTESDKEVGELKKDRRQSAAVEISADYNVARSASEKTAPLLVVDGKPATGKRNAKAILKQGLSKLDPNDVEEIVVLKEPLYIINGSHYSETELFGPNPTSPYYPLNQQEIETLSILQGEKAIATYGKKGEKGVVIITTKNGKPVKTPTYKE